MAPPFHGPTDCTTSQTAQTRTATLKGKKRIIDGLILEVHAAGHPESALALQELADSYEYAALTYFLEGVCRT